MKSLIITLLLCAGLNVAAQKNRKPFPVAVEKKTVTMDIEKFHRYHIDEFSRAEGFGETRIVVMPKLIHLTVADKIYLMSNMRLISITDRKTPVIWEYPSLNPENTFTVVAPIDRTMIKNKHMKKRNLNKNESDWVKALKTGKPYIEIKEGNVFKIIAPLKAENACIRCHKDYKAGAFMGAFLYDLRELGYGLNKKEEENNSEKEKPVKPDKEEKAAKVGMIAK